MAEDRIAISQQVMRRVFEREGVSQLLFRPLPGGMTGHVKVNNATAIMGQYQKHIEDLETNGWNREESMETSCATWFSRKVRQH
jgi:hypothetical protein